MLKTVTHRLEVLRLSRESVPAPEEQLHTDTPHLLEEQLRAHQEGARQTVRARARWPASARRSPQRTAPGGGRRSAQGVAAARTHARCGWRGLGAGTWIDWMTEMPWAEPGERGIHLAAARRNAGERPLGTGARQATHRRVPGGEEAQSAGPCADPGASWGRRAWARPRSARAWRAPSDGLLSGSLGGVHDEAELRGHRRTYVGAMPGRSSRVCARRAHATASTYAGRNRQMSASLHGDPYAALLEGCTPAEVDLPRDLPPGVPFDLSRVLLHRHLLRHRQPPPPVRDRMEVMNCPATRWKTSYKSLNGICFHPAAGLGLRADQCELTEAGAARDGHRLHPRGRRAPVRARNRARDACGGAARGRRHCHACARDAADLEALLQAAHGGHDVALRSGLAGVATGLAWTPAGGDILFIVGHPGWRAADA